MAIIRRSYIFALLGLTTDSGTQIPGPAHFRLYIILAQQQINSASWSYITSIISTAVMHAQTGFFGHGDMDMMEIGLSLLFLVPIHAL
jgi:hypothetical protein